MLLKQEKLQKSFILLQKTIKQRQKFESQYTDPESAYVKYKTDIDYSDINGKTLLDYAAALGSLPKVKEICAERKKLGLKKLSAQPLRVALENENVEIAQYLYDQGAFCYDIKLYELSNNIAEKWLKSKIQETLTIVNSDLIKMKSSEIFRLKLSRFKDNNFLGNLDSKDKLFERLLSLATQIGDYFSVKSLIDKREKFLAYHNSSDSDNYSESDSEADNNEGIFFSDLLLVASEVHHQKLCQLFIENGAVVNPKTPFPFDTPLHAAIRSNDAAIVSYFLKNKAKQNRQNINKVTPLMLAVSLNNFEIVKLLLDFGANIKLNDINGSNIIHYAAQYAGSRIMKLLLDFDGSQDLLNSENIYGYTAFNLAVQNKNNDIIRLLKPIESLVDIQKLSEYGRIPVDISQDAILTVMSYFLKSQYRSTNFFPNDGHCNGFEGYFQYFADRGMSDYYYETKTLIAQWDGSQEGLEREFEQQMPQQKYYGSQLHLGNLAQLMEQWINDIVWLQQDKSAKILKLIQDDRKHQLELIGFFSRAISIGPYILLHKVSASMNEEQLDEILKYLYQMPKGTHLSFGGAEHASGSYLQGNHCIYDDSNFKYKPKPIKNYQQLAQRIIDYKYISVDKYQDKNYYEISIFRFSEVNFNFKVFSENEHPVSREEAKSFQKNSANGFSHLHIAVMTQSLPCIKKLLEDDFCDINAVDNHGVIVWQSAFASNNKDIVKLFLEQAYRLQPNESIGEYSLSLYNNHNYRDMLDLFIQNLDFCHLEKIFVECIKRQQIDFYQKILEKDVNGIINRHLYQGLTPIQIALLHNSLAIFKDLANRGADLHLKNLQYHLQTTQESVLRMMSQWSENFKFRTLSEFSTEPYKLAVLKHLDSACLADCEVLHNFLLDEMEASDDELFKLCLAKSKGSEMIIQKDQNILLFRAFQKRAYSKFVLLLGAGCHPNQCLGFGDEPLLVSCLRSLEFVKSDKERNTRYQFIEVLLVHGADAGLGKAGINAINIVMASEDDRLKEIFNKFNLLRNAPTL